VPKSVAVIGAGAWGSALAMALGRNRQRVALWDNNLAHMAALREFRENKTHLPGIHFPDSVEYYTELSAACQNVDAVLLVVPSHAFASALTAVKASLAEPVPIIWATKGLDSVTGEPLHHAAFAILGADYPVAVLSGPSFSTEVAQGLPTVVNIAAQSLPLARELALLFSQANFSAVPCEDMMGVQLGGALKNVMAIATGISDGLKLGTNARCAIITKGLQEITQLGLALGAQWQTFMGYAGVGDLVLTCSDDQSRNRRFGLGLGQGRSAEVMLAELGTVEGAQNALQAQQLSRKYQVPVPMIDLVVGLLEQKIPLTQFSEHVINAHHFI
jgi:glycerol-3-phosphate dehydrogenase (NAD(P)+)